MAHEILIVDDEEDIRALIAGILADEGFDTRQAWDSDSTEEAIESRVPAMVLLDIWLQGSNQDGIEILKAIRQNHAELPVIMISGHGNIETAVAATRLGAYDFIEKPFETDRLLLSVSRAMEAARLRRENQELRQRAGGAVELIGISGVINSVRQAIDRVAPTGSRVLVSGPPGSGKEVVAQMVHHKSRRASGPFVVLNAATMTPDRMEEELFGIEAGALGADSPPKIGTFEQAHGGTLFIDSVADMPLETQAKILRVLQDQTFARVGGTRPVQVDVRVVAASNRDLATEISEKRFREDLFYRLNVVPIRVPPLRERREDVPVLAKHFMARAAEASGLPAREFASDALALMQTCDWPGNVRQLRNLVDWVLIMAPGDGQTQVGANMLPPELTMPSTGSIRPESGAEILSMPLREAREMFERQYLQAQVTRFGNNISRTASFVGMERSALHRKLKTLGITGEDRG
ncbi:MAG: sigma-54 dependent transcriptional regulator [Alphaproteobacteria bacterium]|jgi:two-component system nitrogen regulation response regulator NtrX|nr:sigma-54 dependent transcriptional regulator [Alphaproteobacteria bacterium]